MTQDEAIVALRQAISGGRAFAVCGSGVSTAATRGAAPSWSGLIRKALSTAMRLSEATERDPWVRSVEAYLTSDQSSDWLEAARTIEMKLGGVEGQAFRDFLHDEIGMLRIADPTVLDALRSLETPVSTTNYDDCLRLHFGYQPETWLDPQHVTAILKGADGIWHIHGHWERPQSVVFSRAGYERIRDSDLAQFLQREVAFERNLLFVGCSIDGLSDDNVGELLRWFSSSFNDIAGPHFALVRESDADRRWPEGVIPVVYGPKHDDLAAFLRTLAPRRKVFTVRDPHMIGRDAQLAEVVRLVGEGRHVVIPGGPGIGKTTLALAAAQAQRVKAAFSRRVFVPLDGAKEARFIIHALAEALGIRRTGRDEDVFAAIAANVSGDPALVILDNAETPYGADRHATRMVVDDLAGLAGLRLIVTIRGETFPIAGAQRAGAVERLEPDEARALFLREAQDDRLGDDPGFAALMRDLDGHPLSIVLLAAQARGAHNLSLLHRAWGEKHADMLRDGKGDHRLTNLRVSLGLSLQHRDCTPAARRLFALLAYLPAGLPEAELDATLPDDGLAAAMALEKLQLASRRGGRISVLAPLRECARVDAPATPEDLGRMIGDWLDMMAQSASAGTGAFLPIESRVRGMAGNFDALLAAAIDAGLHEEAWSGAATGLAALTRNLGLGSSDAVGKVADHARASGRPAEAAQVYDALGDVHLSRGRLDRAAAAFAASGDAARAAGDERLVALGLNKSGDVLAARNDLAAAHQLYEEALAIRRRLCASHPGNGERMRDVSASLNKIGDVLRARNDLAGAFERYEEGLASAREASALDPDLPDRARDVSVSLNKIGDVLVTRNAIAEAMERYEEALAIRRRLGAADPSHSERARDVALSLERIGDAAFARDDLDDAFVRYTESLDIRRALCAADPGNPERERDVSLSLERLGDVHLARRDSAGALSRYEEGLVMRRKLSAADPGHAGWMRDVSVSLTKLGDVHFDRGEPAGALANYEEGLAILRRLSAADPSHAERARDVSVSLAMIGKAQLQLGARDKACAALAESRSIIAPLAAAAPDNHQRQLDLSALDALIAEAACARP